MPAPAYIHDPRLRMFSIGIEGGHCFPDSGLTDLKQPWRVMVFGDKFSFSVFASHVNADLKHLRLFIPFKFRCVLRQLTQQFKSPDLYSIIQPQTLLPVNKYSGVW